MSPAIGQTVSRESTRSGERHSRRIACAATSNTSPCRMPASSALTCSEVEAGARPGRCVLLLLRVTCRDATRQGCSGIARRSRRESRLMGSMAGAPSENDLAGRAWYGMVTSMRWKLVSSRPRRTGAAELSCFYAATHIIAQALCISRISAPSWRSMPTRTGRGDDRRIAVDPAQVGQQDNTCAHQQQRPLDCSAEPQLSRWQGTVPQVLRHHMTE